MRIGRITLLATVVMGLFAAMPAKAVSLGECGSCDDVLLAKFNLKGGVFVFEKGLFNNPGDWAFTYGSGNLSGTWSYSGDLMGYQFGCLLQKAATQTKATGIQGISGTWSTEGILNRGGQRPEISNIKFKGCVSVPEPGSLLAGIAALCLGMVGRKLVG